DTHHGVAAGQEFLDQVTADEAGGTADQYLLHRHPVSFCLSADPVRFLSSSRLSLRPNANRYHRRYLGSQAATRKLDRPSCRSSQIVGISAIGSRSRLALAVSSMPISNPSLLSMPT